MSDSCKYDACEVHAACTCSAGVSSIVAGVICSPMLIQMARALLSLSRFPVCVKHPALSSRSACLIDETDFIMLGHTPMCCTLCILQALEQGSEESSGLGESYTELTGHIPDTSAQFFQHWLRLVELEEAPLQSKRAEIWTMPGEPQ